MRTILGALVWFYRHTPHGHHEPLAAHICKVHSDACVNLMVISEDGIPFAEICVRVVQDISESPPFSYCALNIPSSNILRQGETS
jgi:hypothetical protein